MNIRNFNNWEARLFAVAGGLMFINSIMLWVRRYLDYELSILWAAIPAILAFVCAVIGLFKLYPRVSSSSPKTAKAGVTFAALACLSLFIATISIFMMSVFGEGIPQPAPQGLLLLIGLFMITMICSFLFNAIAFLRDNVQRKIGLLLTVPLLMWALMLIVGAFTKMEVGLSLDFYTNPVMATAFILLGLTLKASVQQPLDNTFLRSQLNSDS